MRAPVVSSTYRVQHLSWQTSIKNPWRGRHATGGYLRVLELLPQRLDLLGQAGDEARVLRRGRLQLRAGGVWQGGGRDSGLRGKEGAAA